MVLPSTPAPRSGPRHSDRPGSCFVGVPLTRRAPAPQQEGDLRERRECDIIVAGLGEDRHAYVLADCSSKGDSPEPLGEDRRHAMRGAVHRSYAQKLVEAGMEQIVA